MQEPIVILDELGRVSSITYLYEPTVTCFHYNYDGDPVVDDAGENGGESQDEVAEER